MAFHSEVTPGEPFKPSVALSNDVRRLINQFNGFGQSGQTRTSQSSIVVQAYNATDVVMTGGSAVTFLSGAEFYIGLNQIFPLVLADNPDEPWGILLAPLAPGEIGAVMVAGVCRVETITQAANKCVSPARGNPGKLDYSKEGVRVIFTSRSLRDPFIQLGVGTSKEVGFFRLDARREVISDGEVEQIKTYVKISNPCQVYAYGKYYNVPEAEIEIFEGLGIFLQFGYFDTDNPIKYVTADLIDRNELHPCCYIGSTSRYSPRVTISPLYLHPVSNYQYLFVPVMIDGVPYVKINSRGTDLDCHCKELFLPESEFLSGRNYIYAVAEYVSGGYMGHYTAHYEALYKSDDPPLASVLLENIFYGIITFRDKYVCDI